MNSAAPVGSYTKYDFGTDDRIRFEGRYWCLKTRNEGDPQEVTLWAEGIVIETVDGGQDRRVKAFTFEYVDYLFRHRKIDWEQGYFSARNAIARAKKLKRTDLPAVTLLRTRMVLEFLDMETDKYETGEFFTRSEAGFQKFIDHFKAENAHLIPPKKGKREVIPGPRQFGRLVERFQDNQLEPCSLLPRHRGGVGQKSDFTPEEEAFHMEHAGAYQSKDRPSKLDCYAQMDEANRRRAEEGLVELKVPSLRTFQRIIDDLGDYRNELTRAGDPSRVARRFGMSRRGYQPQRPLEYVEMDEHKLDVMRLLVRSGIWEFLHPDVKRKIEEKLTQTNDGRVWLSVALDAYSRSVCGAKLLWGAPDGASAVATLAMVARSKEFETRLYGTATNWPQGGTAENIHVDAGASYTSLEFQEAALSYSGNVTVPPSKHPHLRGRVERFFRTINQRYIHLLSGQTFSNVLLRDKYDAQKYRHMTDEQLAEFLVMLIVDCYHNTPHRGLKGLTPLQAWYFGTQNANGAVKGYPSEREYAEAFSVVTKYKVGNYGIMILGLPYSNTWLRECREMRYDLELSVRYNETDISKILVKDPFKVNEWVEVECALAGLKGWRVTHWLEQIKYLKRQFGASRSIGMRVAQAALANARDFAKSSKAAAGIGSPLTTASQLAYWDREVVAGFTIARETVTDYGEPAEAARVDAERVRPDPFASKEKDPVKEGRAAGRTAAEGGGTATDAPYAATDGSSDDLGLGPDEKPKKPGRKSKKSRDLIASENTQPPPAARSTPSEPSLPPSTPPDDGQEVIPRRSGIRIEKTRKDAQ